MWGYVHLIVGMCGILILRKLLWFVALRACSPCARCYFNGLPPSRAPLVPIPRPCDCRHYFTANRQWCMSGTLSHSVNEWKFVRPSPSKPDNMGQMPPPPPVSPTHIFHEMVQVLTQKLISTLKKLSKWKGKHYEERFCVGSKVNQVQEWQWMRLHINVIHNR